MDSKSNNLFGGTPTNMVHTLLFRPHVPQCTQSLISSYFLSLLPPKLNWVLDLQHLNLCHTRRKHFIVYISTATFVCSLGLRNLLHGVKIY